jgi:hypothetical protein
LPSSTLTSTLGIRAVSGRRRGSSPMPVSTSPTRIAAMAITISVSNAMPVSM